MRGPSGRCAADERKAQFMNPNYVQTFNRHRLLETNGDLPPLELERAYYRQHPDLDEAG